MKLNTTTADIFVPDGTTPATALNRTTHLGIGAHQDDTEILAYHGVAECFKHPDKWFTGLVVTNGAGSPRTGKYAAYTDAQMRSRRIREQRRAAELGEYSLQIQLDYASAQVKDPDNRDVTADLAAVISAAKPRTVYVHNPLDKHATHVAVCLRTLTALRQVPAAMHPEHVFGCEVWRDLDWLPDEQKIALPVANRPKLAAALLQVFDSQIAGGKRYDRAVTGRWLANATFFTTHETDAENALAFAMDLTPLLRDTALDIKEYVLTKIDAFRREAAIMLETVA